MFITSYIIIEEDKIKYNACPELEIYEFERNSWTMYDWFNYFL